MRHGPHQGAHASSRTGRSRTSSTSEAKLASVMVIGFCVLNSGVAVLMSRGAPHLPQVGCLSFASDGSTRFLIPHLLQTTTAIISSLRLSCRIQGQSF